MSPRNLARRYATCTGQTPARAIETMRLDAARRRPTEQPGVPVARIAERCGSGDDERMRRAFLRGLGVDFPSSFQRRGMGINGLALSIFTDPSLLRVQRSA